MSQSTYTTVPLEASTWDLFADLVERNNGIFGGCWCIGFHPEFGQRGLDHRAAKEERVRTGRAHAALVLDADGAAQGWAQYGSPEELSGIKHRRVYDKEPPPLPDWRITCVFVDKRHRGAGVARAAVEAALDQIAQAGGRARGGDLRGHHRPRRPRALPLQRHRRAPRGPRLHAGAAGGQARVDRRPHGRPDRLSYDGVELRVLARVSLAPSQARPASRVMAPETPKATP